MDETIMVLPLSPDDAKPATTDEAIVREAADNWQAVKQWQGAEDDKSREDIKFANADPRNGWQWDQKIYDERTAEGTELPCLTINNTRVHNDLIINQMSKNRYAIKVRPTGGKASYKSAEVMNSIIRRIEYISKASSQYRKVAEHQVDGGIGYILLETDYVSPKSFDQDIYLKAARDPTGVYLDNSSTEPDGSDSNFGFVFDKKTRKNFNRKYPDFKDKVGQSPIGADMGDWLTDKDIMVVKYYRRQMKKDRLIGYTAEDGTEIEKLASEIKDEAGKMLFKALLKDIEDGKIDGRQREVFTADVQWFLIAGDQIISRGKWAGKYIPICRCVGRELVIDGKLDRKGHTRPLIDAQRMLNYNASTDVQMNALQPKSPWLASARAIEGQEDWKTANLNAKAVLTFNDIDDEAPVELQHIDAPKRIDPAPGNPAYQHGMENAERQMMMISGQFQAQMGENDGQAANSGKGINARQQQGDTATYHFPEHQGDMLRFIGVQILDLAPHIYDTKRTLHIMDEDGEKRWIQIDPKQEDAVMDLEDAREKQEAVKLSFNPSVGEYECVSDPGPDYATQRQEAWEAITTILAHNMQLAAVIGDLLFQYGDFPGADKIKERLEKEIKATKPYLFDKNVEPQMVALQQQNQRLTALNSELMSKLSLKEIALKGKDERRDIEVSNSETKRLAVMVDFMAKTMLSPADQAQMEHEIMSRSHDASLDLITQANAAELKQQGDPQEQPQ